MIFYTSGNLFHANTDALVNTVNCVGVMGRGIALQFKKRFPSNFSAYASTCRNGEVKPGQMFTTGPHSAGPRWIINFPTKRHWRSGSRMDDINAGLVDLASTIHHYNIRSIAIPPLGCGLGGLNWPDVKAQIEAHLAPIDGVQVLVYEP